jgi:hypothetical protein
MSDSKETGKRGAAAGGSGAPKAKGRGAGGGKPLCRAAKRAIEKNWKAVTDFVDLLEGTKVAISEPKLKGQGVGRVQKVLGRCRFDIIDQEGTPCSVGLAGSMTAPKKIDQSDTCVHVGDLVFLDGGQIKGKISAGLAPRIQAAYTRLEIRCARGVLESAAGGAAAALDEVFEWDREAEEKEAEATVAALAEEKAEFARKWRSGGAASRKVEEPAEL